MAPSSAMASTIARPPGGKARRHRGRVLRFDERGHRRAGAREPRRVRAGAERGVDRDARVVARAPGAGPGAGGPRWPCAAPRDPRGQRRDEQRGPAHVERGVGERDLLGKEAPRARRRRLLGRDPHHDREIAPERDAHHLSAGHRDDASVQRGRRVVGVAFELGGDRHDFARGPGASDARAARAPRAGPQPAPRRKTPGHGHRGIRDRTDSGPSPPRTPERADRRMRSPTRGPSPPTATSRCTSSAIATASNAEPRLAEVAGTRTRMPLRIG